MRQACAQEESRNVRDFALRRIARREAMQKMEVQRSWRADPVARNVRRPIEQRLSAGDRRKEQQAEQHRTRLIALLMKVCRATSRLARLSESGFRRNAVDAW